LVSTSGNLLLHIQDLDVYLRYTYSYLRDLEFYLRSKNSAARCTVFEKRCVESLSITICHERFCYRQDLTEITRFCGVLSIFSPPLMRKCLLNVGKSSNNGWVDLFPF
jgi:hypothetical protein